MYSQKRETSAQLRLREESAGELEKIPTEHDFPLRIRFEAGAASNGSDVLQGIF